MEDINTIAKLQFPEISGFQLTEKVPVYLNKEKWWALETPSFDGDSSISLFPPPVVEIMKSQTKEQVNIIKQNICTFRWVLIVNFDTKTVLRAIIIVQSQVKYLVIGPKWPRAPRV